MAGTPPRTTAATNPTSPVGVAWPTFAAPVRKTLLIAAFAEEASLAIRLDEIIVPCIQ
jgi:hypothetical protein